MRSSLHCGVIGHEQAQAAMVDLLGRAGLLGEALEVASAVPVEPNSVVWGSLLNCCRIHGNLTVTEEVKGEGRRSRELRRGRQPLRHHVEHVQRGGFPGARAWGDRRRPPSPPSIITREERYGEVDREGSPLNSTAIFLRSAGQEVNRRGNTNPFGGHNSTHSIV